MHRTTIAIFMSLAAGLAVTLPGTLAYAQQAGPTARTVDRMELRIRPGRPQTPPVARYVAEGVAEFTLDRSRDRVIIQFQGRPEFQVLYAQRAPRGDVIYRNDVGQMVLRMSGLGGVTVFTAQRPSGAPAQLVGIAEPISLENIRDSIQLYAMMRAASQRVSRVMQRNILFDGPDIGPETYDLVADSLPLIVQVFERDAAQLRTNPEMRRFSRVLFVEADRPGVELVGDTLRITIAKGWGVAGRPSSERMTLAVR